jgi:hypothetical protein
MLLNAICRTNKFLNCIKFILTKVSNLYDKDKLNHKITIKLERNINFFKINFKFKFDNIKMHMDTLRAKLKVVNLKEKAIHKVEIKVQIIRMVG